MQQWEYLVKVIQRPYNGLLARWTTWSKEPDLVRLGEEGWDLVAAVPTSEVTDGTAAFGGITNRIRYIFKRARSQSVAE
jgi:hypothetical protein